MILVKENQVWAFMPVLTGQNMLYQPVNPKGRRISEGQTRSCVLPIEFAVSKEDSEM